MNPNLCQACRNAAVEHKLAITDEEPAQPYLLCGECKRRLEHLALRPLEWFNLAALHSPWKYHLHDDFYDEQGAAYQPRIAIDEPERFPAPTLSQTANDPERLIDYTMSRWFLTGDIGSALAKHSPQRLLSVLNERVSSSPNVHIEARAYEVCAEALKGEAADWIRSRLPMHNRCTLFHLSQACAECLPFEEGFSFVTEQLKSGDPKRRRERALALAWFRSAKVLDWIEAFVHEPFTEDWGRLAVLSNLDWSRVKSWLAKGRPLSLVALDALNACWHYDTVLLERFQPKLAGAWTEIEVRRRIEEYARQDPVPRVQRAVAAAISHMNRLAK